MKNDILNKLSCVYNTAICTSRIIKTLKCLEIFFISFSVIFTALQSICLIKNLKK